jgi:hypothetical protein
MKMKTLLPLAALVAIVTVSAMAQGKLPELHLPAIDPRLLPRPPEVIRTVYTFAAEHPEVLRYMPCFCGCNEMGHRSSEACFVKSRSKTGTVTEWNEHGIACAMCIAVAERAKTMRDAGASLGDTRADIEKRYGHITGLRTDTPLPPKK